VIFAATGVTKGTLLDGAVRRRTVVETYTMMMSSSDGVVRTIRSLTPVRL
jgi:fructose-1,6-bisphosphatase II / sedoheptulose-1,7-bisphosphatase